jgi:putative PIN family toxin of toxin-antitoxin system
LLSVVIDPNVLISAVIAGRGAPASVITAWSDGEFEMIVSQTLLDELEKVLLRPKFRNYLSETEARAYLRRLRALATFFPDPPPQPGLTPDPKDDYLVALARASGVDYLLSGDSNLINLSIQRPPVISAAGFNSILQAQKP